MSGATDATPSAGLDERLRALSFAVGIALVAYAVGNVTLAVVAVFLQSAGVALFDDRALLVLLGTFAIQGVGYCGAVAVYVDRSGRRDLLRVRAPTARDLAVVVVGFLGLLGVLFGLDVLFDALGIRLAESNIVATGLGSPSLLLVLAVLSVVLVGPAEELLYRGLIQGRLRETVGPVGAVALTSAIFAPVHVFGLSGSPLAVAATLGAIFVLSLVLGTLYELTGTLVVPALIHGLYNASQFLIAYLGVGGGV
ncbi:CPBP family intramembrane glutamic endopeptidase [Halomarina halobia]|uniref:CPBP family intramembrane glutamic endopeptidase n=1 Tax=Halomarina halobia TaxID=3033386 RepID=A0ABD6A7A8_9EURY|nr:CPBP family intramembrane glutamic endopeptidase [Halomarina sp. PSR21]